MKRSGKVPSKGNHGEMDGFSEGPARPGEYDHKAGVLLGAETFGVTYETQAWGSIEAGPRQVSPPPKHKKHQKSWHGGSALQRTHSKSEVTPPWGERSCPDKYNGLFSQ